MTDPNGWRPEGEAIQDLTVNGLPYRVHHRGFDLTRVRLIRKVREGGGNGVPLRVGGDAWTRVLRALPAPPAQDEGK